MFGHKSTVFSAGCAVVALAYAPAFGQSAIEPADGVPGLHASIDSQFVYDSNVAESSAAYAAVRGLTLEDEILIPEATVSFLHAVGRYDIFADTDVGYKLYNQNHKLNSEIVNVGGGAKGPVGPCQSDVTGQYDRRQTDLLYLSLAETRNIQQRETLAADATCGAQIGLRPTLGVSETWGSNSNPVVMTANYQTFSGNGGLGYGNPSLGIVSIFGSYMSTDFPDASLPASLGYTRFGYNVYSGGVKYDRELGARIQGMVSLGYMSLVPDNPLGPRFKGLSYSGNLSFRVNPRITWAVAAARSIRPSLMQYSSYAVADNYNTQVDYHLRPRLTVSAGASYDKYNYQGVVLAGPLGLTNDKVKAVYGSVNYEPSRHLSLALDVRWRQRDSNIPGYNYSGTRVGLTLKVPLRP